MKSSLLYSLTLTASALLGWWVGRATRPQVPTDPAESVTKQAGRVQPIAHTLPDLGKLVRPESDALLTDRYDFTQQVSRSPIAMLPELLKKARTYTDPQEAKQRVDVVAMRYAALDPEKSLKEFIDADHELALRIMAGWGSLDGVAAMTWVDKLVDFGHQTDFRAVLMPSFAQANPQRYLQLLVNDDRGTRPEPGTYRTIFSTLAQRDPAYAISLLPDVKDPYARLEGFGAVAASWAHRDPQAALAWAKGLGEQHERANALQGAVRVLADTDPHAAMQALNLIDPGGEPAGETPHAAIAQGLAKQNFEEAVKWVKNLDPLKHNREQMLTTSVLPALANLGATSLVELYRGLDVGGRSSDFSEQLNVETGLLSALIHWKPKDVAGALQETLALPGGESRDCMLNYLCWKLSLENPTQALSMAAQADDATKQRLAGHLARSLAPEGKVAELAQAIKLAGSTGAATMAARDAAALLVKNFPERGAEFLKQLSADLQPAAAAKMMPSMIARDPATAIALAETLPPEALPGQFGVIAAEWAQVNSTDSMRWAQTLPVGPQRDAAAANLAGALREKEPHHAFGFAHEITDPQLRVSQMQFVLNEWLFQDAVAAQNALVAAKLPPDELAQALAPLPDGQKNPRAKDRDADYVPIGEPEAPTTK